MEGRDFARAIIDAWDDPMPMRVFADWLEEQGQPDRAAMLRVGAEVERASAGLLRAAAATLAEDRLRPAWRHCRPEWWVGDDHIGIKVRPDRGLVTLEFPWSLKPLRARQIRWLARADAEGWLSSIALTDHVVRVARCWPETVRVIPLQITAAGIGWEFEPGEFDLLLDRPKLVALHSSRTRWTPAQVARLANRPELRELGHTWGRHQSPRDRRMAFERVASMAGLRSLALGAGGMTDDDLAPIAAMVGLHHLNLADGRRLTDRGLDHLRGLTNLRTLDIVCSDVAFTDDGVAALRRDLPTTQIYHSR